MTQDRRAQIDALLQAHTFPCPFMFKIIGANTPALLAATLQTVALLMGPENQPEVAIRESRGIRHQSITLRVVVENPQQVLELYQSLAQINGVKMVM